MGGCDDGGDGKVAAEAPRVADMGFRVDDALLADAETFDVAGGTLAVRPPEGWERSEDRDAGYVAWRTDDNAFVSVAPDAPTAAPASTRPATKTGQFALNGVTVEQSLYVAADRSTFVVAFPARDGRQAEVTVSAPMSRYQALLPTIESTIGALHFLPSPGR